MSKPYNKPVNTPVGPGTYVDEIYVVKTDESVIVVEMPVTDAVRPHLSSSHCLTPNAKSWAKFEFPADQVSLQ